MKVKVTKPLPYHCDHELYLESETSDDESTLTKIVDAINPFGMGVNSKTGAISHVRLKLTELRE